MKNNLYKKYKVTLRPISVILVSIFLSIASISVFWGRIQEVRAKIIASEQQNGVLNERFNTLNSLFAEARESSTLLAFTLPESNPAIFILAHLNRLSTEHELRIDNLSINKGGLSFEAEGINSVSVSFDLYGPYTKVYTFIADLSKIAPVVNLESVKLQKDEVEGTKTEVRLSGFYADLPDKLPPITSPLDDFTDDEKSTINFLQTFIQPTFSGIPANIEKDIPTGKENPFGDII